jgi:hypothetical protein
MTDSATLKITHALEHIDKLKALLRTTPPYKLAYGEDNKKGERYIRPLINQDARNSVALICGDIVHNLRSALDHAYWEIVSPKVADEKLQKEIQFPFGKEKKDYLSLLKTRYAHMVSQLFLDELVKIASYGDADGDQNLALLHNLDLRDKHKLLIPTGDYAHIVGAEIVKEVPDFPLATTKSLPMGGFEKYITWPGKMTSSQRKKLGVTLWSIYERELLPVVDVVFRFQLKTVSDLTPVVPTLEGLTVTVRNTVERMRTAAKGAP